MEYDFRTRFPGIHRGLKAVGRSVSWGEALRLIKILLGDTTSQTAAAVEGWDFPVSRAELIAMDTYDLTVAANSDPKKRRPKPYPRPFKVTDSRRERIGNTDGRTRAEVVEYLRGLGHNIPV